MRRSMGAWAVVLSLWGLVWPVAAGQVCFRMAPFDDVYQMSSIQVLSDPPTFHLNVRWVGLDVYQLEGTGTAVLRSALDGSIGVSFKAGHNTAFFAGDGVFGNHECHVYATLDPGTISGPYQVECFGLHVEGAAAVANPPFLLPSPGTVDPSPFQLVFDPECASLATPEAFKALSASPNLAGAAVGP